MRYAPLAAAFLGTTLLAGTGFATAQAEDLQPEYIQSGQGQAVREPLTATDVNHNDDAADEEASAMSASDDTSSQTLDGGRVQLISGGVGDSGLDDISAHQHHYDVKLVFAEKSGAYLADVAVQVKDRQGNLVVDTTSDGPVMLMKLEPGSYTVSATQNSVTRTQNIKVGRGLKSYIMHLPTSES